MLTNSLKILDTTKTDIFELIYFKSDEKVVQKHCQVDLSSLLDHLTC